MAYPKVFLNMKNRTAPAVARNAQEEAALDPKEWSAAPLLAPSDANSGYPKLMYNMNIPPVLVHNPDQEAALGDVWRPSPIVIPDVPPVTLDPTSDSVSTSGTTATFTVTIAGVGRSGSWTASAGVGWLVCTPTTPQSEDGTIQYTCAPNATGDPRTGYIYVNGAAFRVDQAG